MPSPLNIALITAATSGIVERLHMPSDTGDLEFDFCVGDRRISARLEFGSQFPVMLPSIIINDSSIPSIAHVDSAGKLCYRDPEGLSVSLRDPNAIVIQALREGHETIHNGLTCAGSGDFVDELGAYWGRYVNIPPVRALLTPSDRIKTLVVWRLGDDVVLVSDTTNKTIGVTNITKAVRSKSVGLYVPVPGAPFDGSFIAELAGGGVSLTRLTDMLDDTNRRILAARLKRGRPPTILVLGVGTTDGQRAVIGLSLRFPHRKPHPLLHRETPVERTAFQITRVDRGALLPRAGAHERSATGHVVMIGCGALGGHVALAIARLGVRRLTLVDPESLAIENVYRHVLGFSEVGRNKATALADRIRRDLLHIRTRAVERRAEQLSDQLLDTADLVVVAVGSTTLNRVLNQRFVGRPFRAVFGWLEPLGLGGHALLLGSDFGGCLECLFVDGDGSERLTAWSDFAAPGQSFARHHTGCGGSFTPFADLDAHRTANLVVELGAEALTNPRGVGRLRSWRGSTNHFIDVGFELSSFAKLPQSQRELLRAHFVQSRCPVCGC